MSLQGDKNQVVDTQNAQLENVTDGIVFRQVLAINPVTSMHNVQTNYLSNNVVEKLTDLTDASIDARLLLTVPEFNALFTLSIPVNAVLPTKSWEATYTSQSSAQVKLDGLAKLVQIRVIDKGLGLVEVEIRLEFTGGATTTEVLNVT